MIKKILIITMVVLAVFLIYLGFKDDKIYYVSLGDGLAMGLDDEYEKKYGYADYVVEQLGDELEVYVNQTTDKNKRTTDISNDILSNTDIFLDNIKKMQNILIKADLITISVGQNEFLTNLSFDYDFTLADLYSKFEQTYIDLEQMFVNLREYCKEEIVFIGYYDKTKNDQLTDFFEYVNNKMETLTFKYEIKYINTYDDFRNNDYSGTYFPNTEGYKVIGERIIDYLNY